MGQCCHRVGQPEKRWKKITQTRDKDSYPQLEKEDDFVVINGVHIIKEFHVFSSKPF